jgi:hypothetical protein
MGVNDMGIIDTLKMRIVASLSPQMMTRQLSKSTNVSANNQFSYEYNADNLTYKDYDDMLKDPQIKSGIDLIRMFLLSRDLIVTPASQDPLDVEISESLEDMFKNMDYPMRKIRNDLYSALIYGYSISEIIWEYDEENNRTAFKRFRPIHIKTLENCFEYDESGDINNIIQTTDVGDPIKIPPEKCLVYTFDESFGDRRGTSLLNAVYDNWFTKQKILTWWNIYLQKHEGPTLAAFLSNPQYKDLARENLDEIHEGRANATFDKDDRVEVIESAHRGEGFKDAIHYHDIMIFRKMNIGTMILGQEDGKGAFAQSKTQNDMLNIFLDGIHNDIASELEILVKQIVDMNWTVEKYPHVEFESFEDTDLLELLGSLKPLIDAMAINPEEQWFKQLIARVMDEYADIHVEIEEQQIPEIGTNQIGQPQIIPNPEDLTPPEETTTTDTSQTPAELNQMKQAISNIEAR